ncbi:MAG: diguanylate cyclase [Nitrospirae bacterium]|nr:diguanylate cyclase [Nitrospirota bacterium]
MKFCFPIQNDRALDSEVYGHFGSAPAFMIVDTAAEAVETIGNADQHHAHGTCSPFRALGGRDIDCVIVGGIGPGALNKLSQAGIRVYRASARTVRENLDLFSAGNLQAFSPGHVCSGHAGGSSCAHH